jgi:hypothetical protein
MNMVLGTLTGEVVGAFGIALSRLATNRVRSEAWR